MHAGNKSSEVSKKVKSIFLNRNYQFSDKTSGITEIGTAVCFICIESPIMRLVFQCIKT